MACTKFAPSFFTKKSLAEISTRVFDFTAGGWRDVDRFTLNVDWPDPDGTGPQLAQMWLRSIQRMALSGPTTIPAGSSVTLPLVRFEAPQGVFDNRADALTFYLWRVGEIYNEVGERTAVTYGQPHGCVLTPYSVGSSWAANTGDCYPRWTAQNGAVGWGTFNKFLVTRVERFDMTGAGSPSQRLDYNYMDTPAWHHDDDPLTTTPTWSEWRGHGQVRVWVNTNSEVTDHYFTRGMNGDSNGAGGTKSVSVSVDGGPMVDEWWIKGREYQTDVWSQLTGVPFVEQASFTRFYGWGTGNGSVAVVPDQMWTRVFDTRLNTWRTSFTDQDVDSYGNVRYVAEYGDYTGTSADNRCTQIEYSYNTVAWIVDRPVAQVLHQGACNGSWVSHSVTYYDCDDIAGGGLPDCAYAATPTKGIVGAVWRSLNGTAGLTTTMRYDYAGRTIRVDGPRTDVTDMTDTFYDPTYGDPTTVRRYLTAAVYHDTTTTGMDRRRMLPLAVTDPNLKVTRFDYDALGRTRKIRTPDETATGTPAVEFNYTVSSTAPSSVRTAVMQSSSVLVNSWVLYDGLGQAVQSQRYAPNGASYLIDYSIYDGRGLVARQIPSSAYTSNTFVIGAGLAPVPASPIREQRAVYDTLRRPIAMQDWTNMAFRRQTAIGYYAWDTAVYPPLGDITVQQVDGFGRLSNTWKNFNGVLTSSLHYNYDTAGNVTSTVDHQGITTSMTYDWTGRQKTVTDPDAGTTTYDYDDAGNVRGVNDGRTGADDFWVWTSYDAFNRPTGRSEQHAVTLAWKWLTDWVYDAANEKGLLDYTNAFNSGDFTLRTNITGYDNRNRPTGVTYDVGTPLGWSMNGFASSYTFGYGYDKADHLTSVTYPAVPLTGLTAAETVTTGYDIYGNPTTMGGYVSATAFNADGTLASRTLGTASIGAYAVRRGYQWNPATGQLARIYADRLSTGPATPVQDLAYTYDLNGNVTSVTNNIPDTAIRQGECFGYDGWNRMTQAYTSTNVTTATWTWANTNPLLPPTSMTLPSTNCNQATSTGFAPYYQTFGFDTINRMTTGPAGTYTYPLVNAARPHAPTSINGPGGNDTYTYDTAGNRAAFVDANGPDYTYTWDHQGRLLNANTAGQITENRYDIDNQRVFRKDPNGTITLYLGGKLEISRASNGTMSARRFYAIGATSVAYRDNNAGVYFILGNTQGSASATVKKDTGTVSTQRYEPYGQTRSTGFPTGTPPPPPATTASSTRSVTPPPA